MKEFDYSGRPSRQLQLCNIIGPLAMNCASPTPWSCPLQVRHSFLIWTQKLKNVIILCLDGVGWVSHMYRNRIDHDIDGAGLVAMSTGRVLPSQAERGLRQSPQRRRRRQRQTGPSPGRRFADSHLVLCAGRHLPAAVRMGTLRPRSRTHQVKINLMNNSSLTHSIQKWSWRNRLNQFFISWHTFND